MEEKKKEFVFSEVDFASPVKSDVLQKAKLQAEQSVTKFVKRTKGLLQVRLHCFGAGEWNNWRLSFRG